MLLRRLRPKGWSSPHPTRSRGIDVPPPPSMPCGFEILHRKRHAIVLGHIRADRRVDIGQSLPIARPWSSKGSPAARSAGRGGLEGIRPGRIAARRAAGAVLVQLGVPAGVGSAAAKRLRTPQNCFGWPRFSFSWHIRSFEAVQFSFSWQRNYLSAMYFSFARARWRFRAPRFSLSRDVRSFERLFSTWAAFWPRF